MKKLFHLSLATAILLSVSFSTHSLAAPPAPVKTASTEKATVVLKPTILFFTASWCRPCQSVKRYVLPDRRVSPLLKDFNLVYVDVNRAGHLMSKYQVRTIPHFSILDKKGQLRYTIKGYQPAVNFASVLQNVLEEER